MILSDVADYVSDKTQNNALTAHNYVGVDNMKPNCEGIVDSEYVPSDGFSTRYQKNDILIGNIRPYFKKIWIADREGGASPDVLVIRPKECIDADYLYACLATDMFFDYDTKGAKGSKMPRGDKNHIMSFPINESNNQVFIGSLIKNIKSKIATNNSVISELEAMAKEIYDYWFVQFDFPDENGKPYKSSGGKMVWCEELNREIPEGWKSGKLKDFGQVLGGATPSTKEEKNYTSRGIAWATPKDLADNTNLYFTHGERDITENGLNSCSATLMPEGTVLMTSRAPIGYLAISANDVCTNQGFKSIVPNRDSSPFYIYYTLKVMMPYIQRYGAGSTFAEVSKEDVENLVVCIPSTSLVKDFHNKVLPMFDSIKNKEEENKELTSLRDYLLPLLMNGQVTFSDQEGA